MRQASSVSSTMIQAKKGGKATGPRWLHPPWCKEYTSVSSWKPGNLRVLPLCLQYLTMHLLSHWRQGRDGVSVSYLISQKTAFLLGWPASSECSMEVVPPAVIFLLVLAISAQAQLLVPENLPGSPLHFTNSTGHKSSMLEYCSQQSLIRLLSGPVT